MRKKVVLLIIAVLGIPLLFLYWVSGIIVFTNKFSTEIEVSRDGLPATQHEIYQALNAMAEIVEHPVDCPGRLGSCRSVDGSIIIRAKPTASSTQITQLRISTEELTGIWKPTPSSDRHVAFKGRVVLALEEFGLNANEILKE